MEDMKTFECAICGKLHNTINDRIKCETSCLKEQEMLEKASREVEKKKDEERISKAIDKLLEDFIRIERDVEKFYEKYGYETNNEANNILKLLINSIF